MEMSTGIWWDAEVLNGRGTRTEFQHEPVYMQGPVNKRECPCSQLDTVIVEDAAGNKVEKIAQIRCENYESCGKNFTECSAFRNWTGRGDYKTSDVMRFIRAVK